MGDFPIFCVVARLALGHVFLKWFTKLKINSNQYMQHFVKVTLLGGRQQ